MSSGRVRRQWARLLGALLALLAVAVLSAPGTAEAAPRPASMTTPTTPGPPPAVERTVVRSSGKRLDIARPKHRVPAAPHSNQSEEAGAGTGPNAGTNIFKAPRRFVGHRAPPTCPDGLEADHKGKCRVYF